MTSLRRRWRRWCARTTVESVYVVTATMDGSVKDQRVLVDCDTALALRNSWVRVYGGRNVCIASRALERTR